LAADYPTVEGFQQFTEFSLPDFSGKRQ